MVHTQAKKSSQTQEVHKIKKVQFCVYSEQDILKNSVCEVTSTLLYNKDTGLPAENGLNDPRMGVSMKGLVCQTCFGDIKECPGHFGHIKLAEVVYHPEFLATVHKILKCVCFSCSKLLVPQDKLPSILLIKNNRKRLKEITKNCSRVCTGNEDANQPGCGRVQPRYLKKKMEIVVRASNNLGNGLEAEDSKRSLRATEVYEIFRSIDDEVVKILGLSVQYSRPENMLIRLLIVAPPPVRPSIELTSSARSEDDLTHLYQSILSTNIELIKAKETGLPRTKVDEIVNRLQSYCAYLMNNDENKAKQKGGRPIKAISQRLKGKEGRLRGNLMGKRVDFSSRTVVSPDPSLELDQLGVPVEIASELTIPETVTQLNIDFLKKLVERGDEWPGARYYISKIRNNEIVDLNFVKSKPNLQYGDIVERHLMDDDFVIFNRQPSLHKMSIMGHRVKVLPFSTFRLNLAVTTPYNADFDGDEMNMHVPQSLETKAEVKHIMHVPKQIVTPQSNRPVMGLNQDALLAIRLFTLRDVLLTRSQITDLLMQMEDWNGQIPKPAIIKPQTLWTGKQILSLIIPKINYIRPVESDAKEFYHDDHSVIIKRGELLVGIIHKAIVGNTRGSLMGCIWIDYGPEKTKDFFTYTQKVVNCWLLFNGFTVGIADTIIPVELLEKIEKQRLEAKQNFLNVLQDTQKEAKKLIVHQPGKTIIQSFEHKVNTLLNDCRAEIGKMLNEKIGSENNIKNMILAGSKGNNINISQISGLVGQQNVEGQRIRFGFLRRTLPHFLKDDFGPESRGFVANSYYKGLTPEEFFFHTMGGREGLIDTAVKTSQTGYMQRRLVKALEDVMVQYDFTVRDSHGNLIQYVYGEDGINGEFIEDQKFDLMDLSDEVLRKRCCFFDIDENKADFGFEDSIQKLYEDGKINHKVRDSLLGNKMAHEILLNEFRQIEKERNELRDIFKPGQNLGILPVNVDRLISYSQFKTSAAIDASSSAHSTLDPIEIIERLNVTLDKLQVIYVNHKDADTAKFAAEQNARATYIFRLFLKYKLCSKRVMMEYKLQRSAFLFLLDEIELCFNKARIHPGEMTGSIAAQSIGETLTQMTLNTFHFAGVSSQNITLGVPRIQEIINCSKNIKGPSMTIYLEEQYRYSPEAVHQLISLLEFTTLGQLAKSSEIYYDPDPNNTVVPEDQDLIFMEDDLVDCSPWVLRITIDPILLGRKGIRFRDIVKRIESFLGTNTLKITESLETANPIILRLRLLRKSENDYADIKKVEQFILEDMPIKGFCKKVSYRRQRVQMYSAKGLESLGPKEGEFVLETSGTDLLRVLILPLVDKRRTTSNHIWDIHQLFGIEATRSSILKEIRIVFEFFNIYVNFRHIALLADTITSNGKLMSISRNGINRVYQSPFRKCSFEETVDILIEAAVYADIDFLKGVTENVMVGQLSKMGTGSFDVIMDNYYLLPSETEKEKINAQWKYFPDLHPVLEVEADLEDDSRSAYLQTPYINLNTPAPATNFYNRQTPLYDSITGAMSPQVLTPYMGSDMTPRHRIALSPGARLASPHEGYNVGYGNANYGPKVGGLWDGRDVNNINQIMSPMLPQREKVSSPHVFNQGMLGQTFNSGNELKYSPLSPHYNASPLSLYTGKTGKYVGNMSPTHRNTNSPYYSPNSHDSPSSNLGTVIGNNIASSSGNNGSPMSDQYENALKHIYNYDSPGYHKVQTKIIKNEENAESSEEEEP